VIVENVSLRAPRPRHGPWLERLADCLRPIVDGGGYPLRFSIVDVSDTEMVVEATVVRVDDGDAYADAFRTSELHAPRRARARAARFAVVQVVPTGVRCEFGGYAGDACPATNLLAAAADVVVTHPNAVNASELNERAEHVVYVEGKTLDDFLLGHAGLVRSGANRVGTFVDPTGVELLDVVEGVLDAARATAGIDCGLYTVLPEPLGVRIEWSDSGCAVGTVLHPDAILDAAAALLAEGAGAIGGVSVIHGVTAEMFAAHQRGEIPNPSGGVEAIITHLVSKVHRVPAAHAPLPYYQDVKSYDAHNARAAAELISTPHYFSVLKGLARAPRIVPLDDGAAPAGGVVTIDDVGAIVVPSSCLGGVPALAGEYHDIPVVAVRENATVLKVTNDVLGMRNVVEVDTYLEAAGVLLALREGISLESLRRPIGHARRLA
jgi:hypothetical protein